MWSQVFWVLNSPTWQMALQYVPSAVSFYPRESHLEHIHYKSHQFASYQICVSSSQAHIWNFNLCTKLKIRFFFPIKISGRRFSGFQGPLTSPWPHPTLAMTLASASVNGVMWWGFPINGRKQIGFRWSYDHWHKRNKSHKMVMELWPI